MCPCFHRTAVTISAAVGIAIVTHLMLATNLVGNDQMKSAYVSDGAEPEQHSEHFLDELKSLTKLGGSYQARGYLDLARQTFQKSVELCNAELGPNAYLSRRQQDGLASFELYCRLNSEGQRKYLSACKQGFDAVGSNDPEKAIPQLEGAIKALDELNWPPSNDTLCFHENLARALFYTRRTESAMEQVQKAREIGLSAFGANTPPDASCLDLMADIEVAQGRYSESIRDYAAAYGGWQANSGYAPYSFGTATKSVRILEYLDDHDRAVNALKAIQHMTLPSDFSFAKGAANAILLNEEGKHAEALEETLKVREKFNAAYGMDDARTLEVDLLRAKLLSKLGRQHDFEELAEDLHTRVTKYSVSPELETQVVVQYAMVQISRHQADEAEHVLRTTIEQEEALIGPHHPLLCDLLDAYAKALRSLNKVQEASLVERREAALRVDIHKMRSIARTDSTCKFPWER